MLRWINWICGVSFKDRKRSEVLYSLFNIQSVAKVVKQCRLRWFGHPEPKSGNDWVSACKNAEVARRDMWVEAGRLGESV